METPGALWCTTYRFLKTIGKKHKFESFLQANEAQSFDLLENEKIFYIKKYLEDKKDSNSTGKKEFNYRI